MGSFLNQGKPLLFLENKTSMPMANILNKPILNIDQSGNLEA
jgi:hypothetical protein